MKLKEKVLSLVLSSALIVSLAPANILSISIPLTAIGKSPTGVNTEYLPPTLFGITKVWYSSLSAKFFNAPFFLSVVTYILFLASVQKAANGSNQLSIDKNHYCITGRNVPDTDVS